MKAFFFLANNLLSKSLNIYCFVRIVVLYIVLGHGLVISRTIDMFNQRQRSMNRCRNGEERSRVRHNDVIETSQQPSLTAFHWRHSHLANQRPMSSRSSSLIGSQWSCPSRKTLTIKDIETNIFNGIKTSMTIGRRLNLISWYLTLHCNCNWSVAYPII